MIKDHVLLPFAAKLEDADRLMSRADHARGDRGHRRIAA